MSFLQIALYMLCMWVLLYKPGKKNIWINSHTMSTHIDFPLIFYTWIIHTHCLWTLTAYYWYMYIYIYICVCVCVCVRVCLLSSSSLEEENEDFFSLLNWKILWYLSYRCWWHCCDCLLLLILVSLPYSLFLTCNLAKGFLSSPWFQKWADEYFKLGWSIASSKFKPWKKILRNYTTICPTCKYPATS